MARQMETQGMGPARFAVTEHRNGQVSIRMSKDEIENILDALLVSCNIVTNRHATQLMQDWASMQATVSL